MDVNSIHIENSPKKKGKSASRKDNAFDAGNTDTTQEIAPLSKATTVTSTQKPHQGNLKNPGE